MRPIQRAAVTGLFALWLAPLSLPADSPLRSDGPDARQALQRLDNEVFLGTLDPKAVADEVVKTFSSKHAPRRRVGT